MEESELQGVIMYLHQKGLTPKQIRTVVHVWIMAVTLGDDAPSYSMVKNWVAEYNHGRTSTEDEHRSGRSVDVAALEMVD